VRLGGGAGVAIGRAVAGAGDGDGDVVGEVLAAAARVGGALRGAVDAVGRDSQAASVATADQARNRRRVRPGIDSTGSP
jgi:hypothetical protein